VQVLKNSADTRLQIAGGPHVGMNNILLVFLKIHIVAKLVSMKVIDLNAGF
jgi:hypothetical protein